MRSSVFGIAWVAWMLLVSPGEASEVRIRKVLAHKVDEKGRAGLSPSLYERDAYQAYLRNHPAKVGGLRYDVLVQVPRPVVASSPVEFRLELRTTGEPVVLTAPVTPGWNGRRWLRMRVPDSQFRTTGSVQAWKASLVQEGKLLAESQSFLW